MGNKTKGVQTLTVKKMAAATHWGSFLGTGLLHRDSFGLPTLEAEVYVLGVSELRLQELESSEQMAPKPGSGGGWGETE